MQDRYVELQEHSVEVASERTRFEFGKNWASFLKTVDDQRVDEAKKSLTAMLDAVDLKGKPFWMLVVAVVFLAWRLDCWGLVSIPWTTTLARCSVPENSSGDTHRKI